MLAARIARDALQVTCVHDGIAMNAHEACRELFFQRLERILDEVFAFQVFDLVYFWSA